MRDRRHSVDVAIIGGGQAGLAASRVLQRSGLEHVVLDAHPRVGESWRRRWQSLTLFTPAEYSSLPDLRFPAASGTYPSRTDVAAYLESYADAFDLPVELDQPVRHLRQTGDGFAVETAASSWVARRVVVATGAFGRPWRPWSAGLDGVHQLHASEYRTPNDVPSDDVLVVGAGNTGVQLALELARSGRTVQLSGEPGGRFMTQRPLGKDLFWWLDMTGAIRAPDTTLVGRRLRANDPIIGSTKRMLQTAGVRWAPRVAALSGAEVTFADGTKRAPGTVLWATGYRHDDRWVEIPEALDEFGVLRTRGLRTPVAGLFVIGRPWQRNRGSALIGFVGDDAQVLAEMLSEPVPASRRTGAELGA